MKCQMLPRQLTIIGIEVGLINLYLVLSLETVKTPSYVVLITY